VPLIRSKMSDLRWMNLKFNQDCIWICFYETFNHTLFLSIERIDDSKELCKWNNMNFDNKPSRDKCNWTLCKKTNLQNHNYEVTHRTLKYVSKCITNENFHQFQKQLNMKDHKKKILIQTNIASSTWSLTYDINFVEITW